MNKIVLIGNLTHDPDTRSTPNGVTVCSFTIAVNRRFASQGGERQTDFFRINAWRQLGDVCSRYLAKGRKVEEVVALLKGLDCRGKGTSCPDQLARALELKMEG